MRNSDTFLNTLFYSKVVVSSNLNLHLSFYKKQLLKNPTFKSDKQSLVWFGLVWFGMVCFGLVWFGMVWYGLVWFGLVWYGLVWFGLVWFGLVWFSLIVGIYNFLDMSTSYFVTLPFILTYPSCQTPPHAPLTPPPCVLT